MPTFAIGFFVGTIFVSLITIFGVSTNSNEIKIAEEVCESNGGIDYIEVSRYADIVCKNGAAFDLYKLMDLSSN